MLSEESLRKLQALSNLVSERCGVILEDETTIEIANVSRNKDAFVFDKFSWFSLLNSGAKVVAIWHTHPYDCKPSEADLEAARRFPYKFLIVTKDDYLWLET